MNTDGSVDLYFGQKAPAGKEQNLDAGKSWFAILRLTDRSSRGSTSPGGRALEELR